MTLKSLHDHHTARVAWRLRRSRMTSDPATSMFGAERRVKQAEPLVASPNLETWMKLVKTSAIAVAISALLAGPVLAQGASSDTQVRGGAKGTTQMQSGARQWTRMRRPPVPTRRGAKTGTEGHRRRRQRRAARNRQWARRGNPSGQQPITPSGGSPPPPSGCFQTELRSPAAAGVFLHCRCDQARLSLVDQSSKRRSCASP